MLQGLHCMPTVASRAQAHLAFVGILDPPHWTAPQMKDLILPIPGEDISQCFPAHLKTEYGSEGVKELDLKEIQARMRSD